MCTELTRQIENNPTDALGMVGYIPLDAGRGRSIDKSTPFVKVRIASFEIAPHSCNIKIYGEPVSGFGKVDVCPSTFFRNKVEITKRIRWLEKRAAASNDFSSLGGYGVSAKVRRERLADYAASKLDDRKAERLSEELNKVVAVAGLRRQDDETATEHVDRALSHRTGVTGPAIDKLRKLAVKLAHGLPEDENC